MELYIPVAVSTSGMRAVFICGSSWPKARAQSQSYSSDMISVGVPDVFSNQLTHSHASYALYFLAVLVTFSPSASKYSVYNESPFSVTVTCISHAPKSLPPYRNEKRLLLFKKSI